MERAASLKDLREDRGLKVELGGEKILLVRDGDAVRAVSSVCPHAGAPLEEGAVCQGRIVCPWHKATFRVSDGALVEPPALEGLKTYPVRVEGDDVFVGAEPTPRKPVHSQNRGRTFAVVGAGAAGVAAAGALREFGFGGRVLLVGREPGLPYDRTSLSKFVVAGQMKAEETPPLWPEEFYDAHRIERVQGNVVRLDVAARELELEDGRRVTFDRALVAPGGQPKTLDIPGVDKQGVHVLRSREDAAAILKSVKPGAQAVILGSSFIGLEVASCLRAQEIGVTVVSPEKVPFAKQFGERIGRSISALHEANGVAFVSEAKAAKLDGADGVSHVVLEDGRRLPADLVIVGVGVRPATDFIRGIELTQEGGLAVDASLRAAEGVYAAGDIAVFPLTPDGEPTRIEHWRLAQQHARAAAANMLGGDVRFEAVPFFWTYHYGQNFEYLGHAETWDEEVFLGDVDKQEFAALFLKGERVVAVVACQRQSYTAALAERMRAPLMREEALQLASKTL